MLLWDGGLCMLFITNRAIDQDNTFEANRYIDFDIDNNLAGQNAFFCHRDAEGWNNHRTNRYTELGNNTFFTKLKECKAKEILIYIHGYSNLPEPDIFPRAKILQDLFDQKEKDSVLVIPLIWPCDNDFGAILDYWDDQKAADASAFAFGRVFDMFMKWRESNDNIKNPCMKRISVLAHSMGNRVLRESIKSWAKYSMNYKLPILFRNTFLVAADMVNETLEKGKSGDLISQCSRNVTVYYASDDLALRASKITNLKNRIASRRLGHTGPEDMSKVSKNVYIVDCDDFNTSYDWPTGHSYFLNRAFSIDKNKIPLAGLLFDHMYNAILTGRVITPDDNKETILNGNFY